jgi:hypothetical protein
MEKEKKDRQWRFVLLDKYSNLIDADDSKAESGTIDFKAGRIRTGGQIKLTDYGDHAPAA